MRFSGRMMWDGGTVNGGHDRGDDEEEVGDGMLKGRGLMKLRGGLGQSQEGEVD